MEGLEIKLSKYDANPPPLPNKKLPRSYMTETRYPAPSSWVHLLYFASHALGDMVNTYSTVRDPTAEMSSQCSYYMHSKECSTLGQGRDIKTPLSSADVPIFLGGAV